MNHNKAFRRGIASILFLSITACHAQYPLNTATPAPDTRIVAAVTDSGTVAMGNAIGPGAVEVEGLIAGANAQAWDLFLLRVDHRDGRSVTWNRELVSFPRNALMDPMERKVDRRRSWLAAGLITAGAIVVASLFQLIGADDPSNPDPIPPN